MGLRDIERKIKSKSAYQRKEAEVMLRELDQMIENVEILKDQLKKFEKEHKHEIEDNKDYYQKISALRNDLGLPNEVGIYEWKESPSLKDKLTGGGYFDQLATEILELGNDLVKKTGGLISVAEIVLELNKSRPGKVVSPKDIVRSLNILADSNLIQPLRKLDSGVMIAEFVSIEMSKDQSTVFDIASREGFLTKETLMMKTGWNAERANRVLEDLVEDGIALKDDTYHEGVKYWFPSLGQE